MHDFVFFRTEKCYLRLSLSDILYVQADGRNTAVVTNTTTFVSSSSISVIQKFLPKPLFGMVHRSYLVSYRHIDRFDNELLYIGKKKIPLAKRYKESLKEILPIINFDTKHFVVTNGDVDKLLRELKQ